MSCLPLCQQTKTAEIHEARCENGPKEWVAWGGFRVSRRKVEKSATGPSRLCLCGHGLFDHATEAKYDGSLTISGRCTAKVRGHECACARVWLVAEVGLYKGAPEGSKSVRMVMVVDEATPARPSIDRPVTEICRCGHIKGLHFLVGGCKGQSPGFCGWRCTCLEFKDYWAVPPGPLHGIKRTEFRCRWSLGPDDPCEPTASTTSGCLNHNGPRRRDAHGTPRDEEWWKQFDRPQGAGKPEVM